MLGILLIRKEQGCTSHDIVDAVRRTFKTRRVGHAGTLDPQATGVLVVGVGPATRFLQYLPLEPKEYLATIDFGRATTTYDLEGETTLEVEPPADLHARIDAEIPKFLGLIQQLPPMFSAVKVKGKPLYDYARKGKTLEREPRSVYVARYDVIKREGPRITAVIECSGGTYVRSLANDLGEAVGCGAHLSALIRTRVGRFELDMATPLDEIGPDTLISLKDALPPMPLLQLSELQIAYVRDGRAIQLDGPVQDKLVGLLDESGEVFSVARRTGSVLQPECVLPAEVRDYV